MSRTATSIDSSPNLTRKVVVPICAGEGWKWRWSKALMSCRPGRLNGGQFPTRYRAWAVMILPVSRRQRDIRCPMQRSSTAARAAGILMGLSISRPRGDNRVWALDTGRNVLDLIYDKQSDQAFNPGIDDVDNLTVSAGGDVLVAEGRQRDATGGRRTERQAVRAGQRGSASANPKSAARHSVLTAGASTSVRRTVLPVIIPTVESTSFAGRSLSTPEPLTALAFKSDACLIPGFYASVQVEPLHGHS